MIHFTYSGNPSLDDLRYAQQAFIDKLGDFKEEFEEKEGYVNINFNVAPENEYRYTFSFPNHEVFEFNHRFNEYQKTRGKE